jgi:hypothetical protein
MSSPNLTPEQQERAQILAEEGLRAAQDEIRQMAELLASKPDRHDLVHKAAARMIQAEIGHRQKKATRGPAPPAPTATNPPGSKDSTDPKPS